jgi:hypothetical protein
VDFVDVLGTEVVTESGRATTVIELLNAWAAHLSRLYREATREGLAPTDSWGLQDYVAALFLRDQLENSLSDLAVESSELPLVTVCDELFRSFTVGNVQPALSDIQGGLPDEPWWWRRTPARGPVRSDIDQIAQRLRS